MLKGKETAITYSAFAIERNQFYSRMFKIQKITQVSLAYKVNPTFLIVLQKTIHDVSNMLRMKTFDS